VIKVTREKSNKYACKVSILTVYFLSSQTHSNPIPVQFLMSNLNGLAGSSPKFASKEKSEAELCTVIVGKSRFTVGLIGILWSVK
jgi:hypothetical protein